ncbi:hypothetical protein [Paenibacillus apii]|uniref:hypothetical protein n=1 Tax=Paenibacillus apii TaxID=1850370 RepID=UPI00143B97CA|nr:hypothetical protein [Paenibacillus apii]NJJ37811.1 hypothetical protein [Paenibacillus apii]
MIMQLASWLMSKVEGGEGMMAMFFAQRVILGKTKYTDVPATLQPAVKELLEESGLGYLTETTETQA